MNSSSKTEDDNKVDDLHAALNLLVKPADEGSKGDLHDILQLNIKDALKKLGIEDLGELQSLQDIKCCVTSNASARWKFVGITLHILLSMKDCLKELGSDSNNKESSKAPADILSVNQQKTIRTCLQFVVSMGMLPSLIPGVGISLAARCTSAHNLKEEDLLVLEKYERLAAVTRGLLACCEHPSLRSLIVTHHLGDLMAALSQICFAPLKKPISGQHSDSSSNDEFVMTQELWNLFQQDRSHFRNCFVSFIWQVYQPFVIRELLLLHGAAGLKRVHTCSHTSPPSWLKRACIQLLVHCLMRPRGVSALIRAICDSNHDSGKDWSKLETVVGLVTTVHTANPEQYYKNICSQILEMLSSAEDTAFSHIQTLVAVKCIEVIHKREPKLISQHFLGVLMDPLCRCTKQENPRDISRLEKEETATVVTEEYLSRCILNMHRVFVEYCTVSSALSPSLYSSICSILFQLYCKICKSPSFLVTKVEDLLMKFLSNLKTDSLYSIYRNFLFGDPASGVLTMDPGRFEFSFGPTGGVCIVMRRPDGKSRARVQDIESRGDCLLHLISTRDNNGKVTTDVFMALLQCLCSGGAGNQSSEDGSGAASEEGDGAEIRHDVTVNLLGVLLDSAFIHENIANDPGCLIDSFLYLLERDYKNLCDQSQNGIGAISATVDVVTVVMTVAVAFSKNTKSSINWKMFERIVEPLKLIRDNAQHEELKKLAGEVYNIIVSCGEENKCEVKDNPQPANKKDKVKEKSTRVGKKNAKHNKSEETERHSEKKIDKKTTSKPPSESSQFKEAIMCACDSSIPVHGHGLLQLTKLITGGDEYAIANKDMIFKLFQGDLKCEDSYVYLLAINGLAAMATMFPDTVIKLLVDEYVGQNSKTALENVTEIRLKIGEVLVRVSKTLDCNSPSASILLDAFLRAVRDPEPTIRASSLSNLGEVCKIMGFRVEPVIYEILVCIRGVMQSDTLDVRTAAVMVLALLLQGLGSSTFEVLGDELREIYRNMKILYEQRENDPMKLQLQLALEEMNKMSEDFLCPKQKFEKRLFILDSPPK